jgi:hypothetical protein
MPFPTAGDLHIDTLMTQVSIAYQNKSYIADQLFPIVPVNKQSDIIPFYDQSHWFRDEARLRAPGTKSQRGGYSVNTTNKYFCDRYSYGREIDDEVRANADAVWNLDRDATGFATDKLFMRREVAFSNAFFTTSVWGADKVGGTDFTKWSDYGGSSPLNDVTNYKDAVEALIAVEPGNLVLGKLAWIQLKWHPDILDTIKYTQRAQMTVELFAALLELDKVFIGRTIYTTSGEGTAESSVTYTRIWGKHALLLYTPPAPSLLTPSAGYTFVWQRVPNAIQYVKRMRDEEREVDIVEVNSYFAQTKVIANAGLFMQNTVA